MRHPKNSKALKGWAIHLTSLLQIYFQLSLTGPPENTMIRNRTAELKPATTQIEI
jgi:hypothetical protein